MSGLVPFWKVTVMLTPPVEAEFDEK